MTILLKKKKLTNKELLRRWRICKPYTVKKAIYGLTYMTRTFGITLENKQ